MIINYINLTNGLCWVDKLYDYSFIRIQSTWCEQKKWNDILYTLSDDLLFNLAIGNHCIIYDCSSKDRLPRALWQGVEVIKYFLNKYWFEGDYKLENRASYMKTYLNNVKLEKSTIKKLKYYKKFLKTDKLQIDVKSFQIDKDGDYEYFKNMVSVWV